MKFKIALDFIVNANSKQEAYEKLAAYFTGNTYHENKIMMEAFGKEPDIKLVDCGCQQLPEYEVRNERI